MNIQQLAMEWPIGNIAQAAALKGGTNNLVWRINTSGHDAYVLRIGRQRSRLALVNYEAKILQRLHEQSLPFQVPVFLPDRQGNIVHNIEMEDYSQSYATMTRFFPGTMPVGNTDAAITANAGATLAILDKAFATFGKLGPEHGIQPTYGELSRWNQQIGDPVGVVEHLPIEQEEKRQIETILTQTINQIPALYQFPQQIVHRDFAASNILAERQRITAVLDFEFAGIDIRVLDLCIALSWWPVRLMETGEEWPVIDTFAGAYLAEFPLTTGELLALPMTFRLRDCVSLLYRIERFMAGLETPAAIQKRVQHSLWREAWLASNTDRLRQHALQWLQ